ncbi:MAG: hypothetical protein R2714_06095 [Microthrixaceae bacterium]
MSPAFVGESIGLHLGHPDSTIQGGRLRAEVTPRLQVSLGDDTGGEIELQIRTMYCQPIAIVS